jgi:hypothetical protein
VAWRDEYLVYTPVDIYHSCFIRYSLGQRMPRLCIYYSCPLLFGLSGCSINMHDVQPLDLNIMEHPDLAFSASEAPYTSQLKGHLHLHPANPAVHHHAPPSADQTTPRSHTSHRTYANSSWVQTNSLSTPLHRSSCVAATAQDTPTSSHCECRRCSCTIRPSIAVTAGTREQSIVRGRSGNLPGRLERCLDRRWGGRVW